MLTVLSSAEKAKGNVIHTVGPVARGHVGPTESNDLTSCYQNSLRLMKENDLSTVVSTLHYQHSSEEKLAFPCISTGIYGFPNEPAADIALKTVKSWIDENPDMITRVIFCVFLETDFAIYKKKMSVIFPDNDMEVTEEQLKEGKEEIDDEEEGDNDAAGNEDVEMESQNPDEISGNQEPNQEKDENETQEKDEDVGIDNDEEKDEDKGIENNKEEDKGYVPKAEEEQPAAKAEDDDTAKPTVEMEGGLRWCNTSLEAMMELLGTINHRR
ncbi:hypothetical protein F7725_024224 [Dissostichus mawsoni]|uniref:Macro domain-containing protein n=1 Tax=Dissostichus mawsoni TaxID=36200 RepID=A0A7J5XZP7_DISMA|nr:hypothetical protein F7725_024224 [Dissostichus mawsoni]